MRRPVNQLKPEQKRQAAWDAIRAAGTFTCADIWRETALRKDTIREYFAGLEAAGYIQHVDNRPTPGGRAAKVYVHVLDRDCREAPRLRADGTAVTQGQGRALMWRTMRIIKEFTAQDLAVTATTEQHAVAVAEAEHYCRYLALAGYLRQTGRAYRFQVHRYTGPKAPQIQRVKQVWDPNTETVAWTGGDA